MTKLFIIGMQPQFAAIYLEMLREIQSDNNSRLDLYKRKFDVAMKRQRAIPDDLKQRIIFLETEDEIIRGRISDMENIVAAQSPSQVETVQ
jgi:hypothetical protein